MRFWQVSAKDMYDHILKLTVIDGGRTKRRSEIGHVAFPLKDLEIGDGSEQQLFKLDLEKVRRSIFYRYFCTIYYVITKWKIFKEKVL